MLPGMHHSPLLTIYIYITSENPPGNSTNSGKLKNYEKLIEGEPKKTKKNSQNEIACLARVELLLRIVRWYY